MSSAMFLDCVYTRDLDEHEPLYQSVRDEHELSTITS